LCEKRFKKQASQYWRLTLFLHTRACPDALRRQAYGDELLAAGMDVAGAVATAADGERDPRCLLRAFACVRAAAALHSSAATPLAAHAEAADVLFDTLAMYFPVSFTPPPVNKVSGLPVRPPARSQYFWQVIQIILYRCFPS